MMNTQSTLPTTLRPLRALRVARVAFYRSVRVYLNATNANMPAIACEKYLRVMLNNARTYQNLLDN